MGRWERTHEALRAAAWQLFADRGYDATTTALIAARAGVSEMTLFRHFPTKEALLLADPFDPVMADAVRTRPGGEPPLRALAEGIRQTWQHLDADRVAGLPTVLAIVARTPTLRGAIERSSGRTAAELAAALSDRGVPPGSARVAAAAMIAGLSAALLDWADSGGGTVDAVIASALDVLGGQ